MQKDQLLLLLLSIFLCAYLQAEQVCQRESIPASTPSVRFVVNSDNTLTDTKTHLVWKRCLEGLEGSACEQGSPIALNWAEALLYLNTHQSEWRLPNIRELSTLVETQCANPAINLEVFPGALSSHVWTSSPYHFYTHYSWYVDFQFGLPTYDERIRLKMLRLVRNLD